MLTWEPIEAVAATDERGRRLYIRKIAPNTYRCWQGGVAGQSFRTMAEAKAYLEAGGKRKHTRESRHGTRQA